MTFDRATIQELRDTHAANVTDLAAFLNDFDSQEEQLAVVIAEKDVAEAALGVVENEQEIAEAARDLAIADLATANATITTLEAQIVTLNGTITTRNATIATLQATLASGNALLQAAIAERDAALADLAVAQAALATEQALVTQRQGIIVTRNATIATRNATIASLNAQIASLTTQQGTLTSSLASLNATITTRNATIASLEQQIEDALAGGTGTVGSRVRTGANIKPTVANGGALEVRRIYYQSTNHFTRTNLQTTIDASPETKVWLVNDNIATLNEYSRLAAGTPNAADIVLLDQWKDQWRITINNNPDCDFFFTVQHEPNNTAYLPAGVNAAMYRAAVAFAFTWIRGSPVNAKLKLGICCLVEGYQSADIGANGYSIWDPAQAGFDVDFYAVDVYNWGLTTHSPAVWRDIDDPIKAQPAADYAVGKGKTFCVWETNCKPDPALPNRRPDWLTRAMRWFAAVPRSDVFCMYGGGGHEGSGGGDQNWCVMPTASGQDFDTVADPVGNALIQAWGDPRRNR